MRCKLIARGLLFAGLCVCLTGGELWLKNTLAFNTGRIVFTSTRDGNSEIYVMDADGGKQERLTDNPTDDSYPAWSPDQTKIAFVSNRNGGFVQIHVMDADGQNPIRLTRELKEVNPEWSPDGQKIAFTSWKVQNMQNVPHVIVMDADGHNNFKLTDGRVPSWSPDGTRVAFEFRDAGVYQIYVINVNKQGPKKKVTRDLAVELTPAWSPDGQQIAYASQKEGFFQIYVVDADGKNRKRLTHDQLNKRQPAWSPDGQTIAYVIFKPDDVGRIRRTIHLMTADGQYLKQLSDVHNGSDFDPDFGPGGLAVFPTSKTATIWGRLKKTSSSFR